MPEISKAMPFKILKLKVVYYVFPFSPKCSKIAICGLLETNLIYIQGYRLRHAIVYIPTADSGKNL